MATKIKQLTHRRVPRRCSAHVAAIVLSPAQPLTGTHRFVSAQMKLPLCVPTGCQTHCKHCSLSGTVSPSRSEKPPFSAYTGVRGGRGLLLTHDHFYPHGSTSCFPRCFPCAVRGVPRTVQPRAARPQDPLLPTWLILEASTCLPAFTRPTGALQPLQRSPGGLHLAHRYTWFGLYSFKKKKKVLINGKCYSQEPHT